MGELLIGTRRTSHGRPRTAPAEGTVFPGGDVYLTFPGLGTASLPGSPARSANTSTPSNPRTRCSAMPAPPRPMGGGDEGFVSYRRADVGGYAGRLTDALSVRLGRNLTVVPVLVGGATMPAVEDLPPDLAELPRRLAVVVRDESFHTDLDRLVRSLRGERIGPPRPTPWRRPAAVAALAFVLFAGGTGTLWFRSHSKGGANDSTGPTGCPPTASADWTDIPVRTGPQSASPTTMGRSRSPWTPRHPA
jgi:hypothetical protein